MFAELSARRTRSVEAEKHFLHQSEIVLRFRLLKMFVELSTVNPRIACSTRKMFSVLSGAPKSETDPRAHLGLGGRKMLLALSTENPANCLNSEKVLGDIRRAP